MSEPKPLKILEYVGFRKHRAGRIHVICPTCGRKQSNMPRCDEITPKDPPTATLVGVWCERCSDGCKVEGPAFYRDAEGRELCQMCGRHDCELMGGRRRCDESLIYESHCPSERAKREAGK